MGELNGALRRQLEAAILKAPDRLKSEVTAILTEDGYTSADAEFCWSGRPLKNNLSTQAVAKLLTCLPDTTEEEWINAYLSSLKPEIAMSVTMMFRTCHRQAAEIYKKEFLDLTISEFAVMLNGIAFASYDRMQRCVYMVKNFSAWCSENGRPNRLSGELAKAPSGYFTQRISLRRATRSAYLMGPDQLEELICKVEHVTSNANVPPMLILAYIGLAAKEICELKRDRIQIHNDSVTVNGIPCPLTTQLCDRLKYYDGLTSYKTGANGGRIMYAIRTSYFIKRFPSKNTDNLEDTPLVSDTMRPVVAAIIHRYREMTGEQLDLSNSMLRTSGILYRLWLREVNGETITPADIAEAFDLSSASAVASRMKIYKDFAFCKSMDN